MARKKPPADPPPKRGAAALGERGQVLWRALGRDEDSAAGALALEACRIADRLEELNEIIAGRGVLDLLRFRLSPGWWDDDGQHVQVRVEFSNPMGEARQQALALKAHLERLGFDAAAPAATGEGESPLAQVLTLVQAATKHSGGAG